MEPSAPKQFSAAVVAIGDAANRLDWIEQLQAAGYHLPALQHPTAWVWPSAQLGPASVVFAQVAVQAQYSIGTGAILYTCFSVDYDAHLLIAPIFAQVFVWRVR